MLSNLFMFVVDNIYIINCVQNVLLCIPLKSSYIFLAVLGEQGEVNRELELGKKALHDGQLGDAVLHYSAAIGQCEVVKCIQSTFLVSAAQ